MDQKIEKLNLIAQTIYDKKGFNILVLDVQGASTLTDYFIIAEGNVDRHLRAISLHLQDNLRKIGEKPWHVEGDQSDDWVVLDYCDFVIHLFTPDMREKYGLEQLWKEATVVDVNIKVPQNIMAHDE